MVLWLCPFLQNGTPLSSTSLIQKLTVAQPVQKFPALYGAPRFTVVVTWALLAPNPEPDKSNHNSTPHFLTIHLSITLPMPRSSKLFLPPRNLWVTNLYRIQSHEFQVVFVLRFKITWLQMKLHCGIPSFLA
jgi:hypothetical protein